MPSFAETLASGKFVVTTELTPPKGNDAGDLVHGWLATPVLRRADLATRRAGPLIIEEYDATCVVPPGALAERDAADNIVITVAARQEPSGR